MTQTICAYAQFTKSLLGVNGLTVTWDVERITRSDGTRSALVTGGANGVVVGRRGLYGYVLTGADLSLYDYLFTAITAGDVDLKEVPAVWTSYSVAYAAELARLDDTITSRLAAAGYTVPPSAAAIADAVMDEAGAGHSGLIPTNLDAKVSTRLASVSYSDPLASTVPGTYATGSAGAALGKLGVGQVVVQAPVAESGDVLTYQGVAYLTEDNLALTWTVTLDVRDLTGCTAKLYVNKQSFTATITHAGEANQTITVELAMTDSAKIARGVHEFMLVAKQADLDVLPPLVDGKWTSKVYEV